MHEFAIVQEIVAQLLAALETRSMAEVHKVHLRRGVHLQDDMVRQAYTLAVQGTPFEKAALVLEAAQVRVCCTCGYSKLLADEDLISHVYVCPACGVPQEIEGIDRLEVVHVVTGAL